MGGGLMQLVAYGAQDIYLTGNPQITFFKVVYRRHTNFAMECVEQTLSGTPSNGASVTATVSRNGDLVGKMYVTSSTSAITAGDEIVSVADVEIGGQRIDRHYAEWMQISTELSTPESKALGVKAMTGCVGSSGTTGVGMVQVPLQFWFCRNPGLALPLIALQYHEVKVKLTLGSTTGTAGVKLLADYIYLDTDERRRFAQVSHEYLIEQVQREESTNKTTHTLNFNHPVKELIWTSPADNAYANAKLQLNGHDRFSTQEEEYFQLRQPSDHHTAIPAQNLPEAASSTRSLGIDIFSGSYTPTQIISLNFANTAVTTQKVIVSTGVTASAGAITGTLGVTTAQARAATQLSFSFLKSDLHHVPIVGDILDVEVSGTESASGTAFSLTAGGPSVTVRTKVNAILDGAAGGLTNALNYHIMVDQLLTEPTLGAEIDAVDSFTILSMRLVSDNSARTSKLTSKINCYSFALKPEEHQPSGTCNFSRIDNAKLVLNTAPGGSINIYAVNYNVLRVMSGMGGLAYSN